METQCYREERLAEKGLVGVADPPLSGVRVPQRNTQDSAAAAGAASAAAGSPGAMAFCSWLYLEHNHHTVTSRPAQQPTRNFMFACMTYVFMVSYSFTNDYQLSDSPPAYILYINKYSIIALYKSISNGMLSKPS